MAHEFTTSHLADSLSVFRLYKRLGEGALAQVPDDKLNHLVDPEALSVALIVKHIAGNMRSRWTDFLTTDGEKPDRNRDSEFEADHSYTRAEVMKMWEDGWNLVFNALGPLTEADLAKKVMIRSEPHSVTQAINRQIAHYAYHVGQIVFLAKHFQSGHWKSLTVPKKGSADFNERVKKGEASQR